MEVNNISFVSVTLRLGELRTQKTGGMKLTRCATNNSGSQLKGKKSDWRNLD